MANGPFTTGNGRIAADLYDFLKHVGGEGFVHNAESVTNSPGVGGASTVQGSINNIISFIASLAGIGTAFASIPDGYNSYTNPAANYYFDNSVPSLSDFLIPLFAAIASGTGIPSGYERLSDGGILYIPAGTYYITSTVSIPPGITILGEGFGTKIINATSLDVSLSPPQVDAGGTPAPVFEILQDTDRTSDDYKVDSVNVYMFARATRILNLTIADNFIEPTLLGDVYYGLPQNTTGDNPLIFQNQGSNLELHNVYLLGRAIVTDTIVSSATRFAVKLDTATPVAGSILKIENCFIDGFSLPISFDSAGGVEDYLCVSNSKIRSHGYLDGDDTDAEFNCIIHSNDGNAKITNNDFYGNHTNLNQIVYIKDVVAGSIDEKAMSRITIATNNFILDRNGTYSGGDPAFKPYIVDSAIQSDILNKAVIIAHGNNSSSSLRGYTVVMSADGSTQIDVKESDTFITNTVSTYIEAPTVVVGAETINLNTPESNGRIIIDGSVVYSRVNTVASQPYTIDAGGVSDYIILVDLTTIAAETSIVLPGLSAIGRTIIIKDRDGLASTYNILVSGGTIDGLSGTARFSANYGSWTFVQGSSGWHLV